jgi:hypothetical protein
MPFNDPLWQSAQSGIDVNHCPWLISWHSLGGGDWQIMHGMSLILAMCNLSPALGLSLFLLCIIGLP